MLKETNQYSDPFEHPWDFRYYPQSITELLKCLLDAMLLNNRISLNKLRSLAGALKIASDRLHMK